MSNQKKAHIITSFKSENELRTELIMPLFRKMGFTVIDNQGSDEYGTDVILKQQNSLGKDEYTSIVLKCGKINNVAGNPNSMLRIILDQVQQAMTMPLDNPEVGKDIFPNNVWIATNNTISKNAKSVFAKHFKNQFKTTVNCEFIDQNMLINLLDKHWPEFYQDRRPLISQYSEILKSELIGVNISEISGGIKRDVSSVLIPQMLARKKSFDEKTAYKIDQMPLTPMQFIKKATNKLCFIVGEAGAGKSTLLKRLAIEILEDNKSVPIVVPAVTLVDKNLSIERIYRIAFENTSTIPIKEILKELSLENIILLIDGFDEIRCGKTRKEVLKKLEQFAQEGNKIEKLVISTRPETDQKILALSKSYKIFEVMPVENKQIPNFFSKWFGVKNKHKAASLYDELSRKSILDKLPKTPLTLTLLAILYETKGDIPTTLTELYRMFSDLLLGKWDQKKGINTLKDAQVRYGLLSFLAWKMHKEGCTEVTQDKLVHFTKEYLSLRLGDEKTDPKEIIQDIIERSGLLWPTGNFVRFKHLSFQEFFCSQEIYSKNVFGENVKEWVDDQWWSDVLFFSAGSLKSIDDYVDVLVKHQSKDLFVSSLTKGAMLQAAYETSVRNKVRLIDDTKSNIPNLMEEVKITLKDIAEINKIPNFLPYIVVIEMISNNYYSKFLEKPLQESYRSTSPKEYLSKIFLSASLSKSGNLKGLEDLATDPDLKQPEIILLADLMLDEYDNKYNDGKLSSVHKSIKSKVKKNARAIQTALSVKIK